MDNRVRLPILLVVSRAGKSTFPYPRSRQRIWSRETGSAVPSRVSLLILHTPAEISGSFNERGEGRLENFPVLGGDGTKTVPPGDIFDQPPCERSSIQTKFADNVGDRVVLSPEGAVMLTSPGGNRRILPLHLIVERFSPRFLRWRPFIRQPPSGQFRVLSGHATAWRWPSLPRVHRHRASSPEGSSSNGCCLFRYHHGPIYMRLLLPGSGHVWHIKYRVLLIVRAPVFEPTYKPPPPCFLQFRSLT